MKRKFGFYLGVCSCLVLLVTTSSHAEAERLELPEGFVFVKAWVPDIQLDIRYHSTHNFVGRKIDGYGSARAVLTIEAATALRAVQKNLAKFHLGLKIFDGYRPQQAVDQFVRWAKDLKDQKMKSEFYPDVDKQNLFKEGYIAARSSHSRGSTVDLTIVSLREEDYGVALNMGSSFDYFGPESWPDYPSIPAQQRANRMLLQSVMTKHGFTPYPQEWWHFTLANEPYPETYFNFPIP